MPSQTATQLGKNIRKAMVDAELTQRDLANRIPNMSQAGVYRRLSGEVEFTVAELRTFAFILDVPVESLMAFPSKVAA